MIAPHDTDCYLCGAPGHTTQQHIEAAKLQRKEVAKHV